MKRLVFGALILLFCAVPMYAAKAYTDVPADQTFAAVHTLSMRGVLSGYGDGTFRPHAPVTRAEFAKMLTTMFAVSQKNTTVSPLFRDVASGDWYAEYVNRLYSYGIIQGYLGGLEFRPHAQVTRAEAVKMGLLTLGVSDTQVDRTWYGWERTYSSYTYVYFRDVMRDAWYAKYVLYAFENNVLSTNTAFRPADPLTRLEAASLLMKLESQKNTLLFLESTRSAQNAGAVTWADGGPTDGWVSTKNESISNGNVPIYSQWEEVTQVVENVAKTTAQVSNEKNTTQPAMQNSDLNTSNPGTTKKTEDTVKAYDTTSSAQSKSAVCTFSAQSACSSEEQSFFATGTMEGRNIRLILTPVTARLFRNPKVFVETIDKFYENYLKQVAVRPYNGAKVEYLEVCSFKEGITYQNHRQVTNESCPFGYMWFNAWGLAGNPIEITSDGWKTVAKDYENGNITFGVVHELAHVFDDGVKNRQYIFDSTSTEATANFRIVLAMKDIDAKIALNGQVFASQKQITNFYLAYFRNFKQSNGTFKDLFLDNPVVGSLADIYLGFWLDLESRNLVSQDDFYDLQQIYSRTGMRIIPEEDREGRFLQEVFFLTCISGRNILNEVGSLGLSVSSAVQNAAARCLQDGSQNPVTLDQSLSNVVVSDTAKQYLENYANSKGLATKGYVMLGNTPVLLYTTSGGINEAIAFDAYSANVYAYPWWFLSYLQKTPTIANRIGAPTSEWRFDAYTRKWIQRYQSGTLYAEQSDPTIISYELDQ